MKIYCPYCKKEIALGEIQCSECSVTYGLETLLLIKKYVKEVVKGLESEQRKYDRIPKKIRVIYQANETLRKSFLSNISRGGIFIPTRTPLKKREKVNMQIFLPDGKAPLEVFGEVAWARGEGQGGTQGKYPSGMGIKFLRLSKEGKERIISILRSSPV